MCLLSFVLYGTFVMKYDVVWCKSFYPKKKIEGIYEVQKTKEKLKNKFNINKLFLYIFY